MRKRHFYLCNVSYIAMLSLPLQYNNYLNNNIIKKWVVFLLGLVAGCILTILSLVVISKAMTTTDTVTEETANHVPGLNLFDEPGDEFSAPSFEVMQVLASNVALAHSGETEYGRTTYYGTLVLLIGDENTHFYDDQIVEVKSGQVARHIGTYQYQTKMEMQKTVPVISIFDKQ
ncbi:MAG: hypothetical protein E7079_04280 [Bacteroidales bacterium]|nr:hypothetical protein [Bacteroidales bacterium]